MHIGVFILLLLSGERNFGTSFVLSFHQIYHFLVPLSFSLLELSLYYVIQCYIILYLLYYIKLHYIILFCVVLYYTVLYYIILLSQSPLYFDASLFVETANSHFDLFPLVEHPSLNVVIFICNLKYSRNCSLSFVLNLAMKRFIICLFVSRRSS